MNFFSIMPAWATDAASQGGWKEVLPNMVPFILIMIVFYFFLIRPQQVRMRKHQEMLAGMQPGQKVLTASGLIAVIKQLPKGENVEAEIAPGVVVQLRKSTINEILSEEENRPSPKKVLGRKNKDSKDKNKHPKEAI